MNKLRLGLMRFLCLLAAISSSMYLGIAGCNSRNFLSQSSEVSTKISKHIPKSQTLIEATLAKDEKQVLFLLQNGTDPNVVDNTNTALTYSARDGSTKIASLLIEYGADVNWIDGEGVTPLILASFKGHVEIVKLLLNNGADKTVKDQWNRTALDYALRRGKGDPIVQMLKISR